MASATAAELCDMGQTETKGVGLFAKVTIAKGKTIFDEAVIALQIGDHEFSPATWVNPDFQEYFRTQMATLLERQMSNLLLDHQNDKFQQAIFKRLSRSIPGDGLNDHVKLVFANCFEIRPQPPRTVLFGLTTCAMNHSCVGNTGLRIYAHPDQPSMLRTLVVTNKEIEAGTEITVSYKLINDTTAERRRQLHESYGFHCVCDYCLDDSAETAETYDNISKLWQIVTAPLDDHCKKDAPWLFWDAARELVAEYEELGIQDQRRAELLEKCATVAAYHSDALRTHHCLRLAEFHWQYLRPNRIRENAPMKNDPAKHPSWGNSVLGLSSIKDNDLFEDRAIEIYARVMMTGHAGSYDRIRPKEEALAEEEILARKAGDELIAEAEAEKGKQAAATPAKKSKKKKRKSKGKKGVVGGDREEEETAEPISAAPDVRLNAGEEGGDGELGGDRWEVVGGKKRSQQRAQEAAAAPVAKMETVPEPKPEPEMEPVAAAPAAAVAVVVEEEEEEKEMVEEVKGEEVVEGRGRAEFSVGDAAVAAEEGRLGRMRAYSQPAPFSPAAVADDDPLVLPGREDMGLYARYLRSLVAQMSQE